MEKNKVKKGLECVGGGPLRKRHLSQELETGATVRHVGVSGKGHPGSSNSKCKGPEAHML